MAIFPINPPGPFSIPIFPPPPTLKTDPSKFASRPLEHLLPFKISCESATNGNLQRCPTTHSSPANHFAWLHRESCVKMRAFAAKERAKPKALMARLCPTAGTRKLRPLDKLQTHHGFAFAPRFICLLRSGFARTPTLSLR